MATSIYFGPELTPESTAYTLEGDEFHHCVHVMRQTAGDQLTLIDGSGGFYEATIQSISKRSADLIIHNHWRQEKGLHPRFSIAIAPTKQASRLEWCLEKLTEIGVADIHPFQSTRSERPRLNTARLEKILLSATKQSQRALLPKLHPLRDFEDIVGLKDKYAFAGIAMRHPRSRDLSEYDIAGKDVLILVGPEGDFTEQEWELALEQGFQPVHLGIQRLRTETAAIYLASIVHGTNTKI